MVRDKGIPSQGLNLLTKINEAVSLGVGFLSPVTFGISLLTQSCSEMPKRLIMVWREQGTQKRRLEPRV